jgi:outer membrane protein
VNRRVKVLCTAAVLALGMATTASAETKIGFVNYNRLLQESPQAKTALEAIRTEFAPREKDIQTQGAALKAREEKLTKDAATMSEVQRAAADKELRDGYRELQRKQAEVQDDFNARRNEEMSRLQRVLLEEVGVYAKAQGFDLVLGDGVLFATSGIDITGSILTALQSRRAGAAPAAAPPARAGGEAPEPSRIAGAPAATVSWSLGELAVRFGCELRGDPAAQVDSWLPRGRVRFRWFRRQRRVPRRTARHHTGAVVLDAKLAPECPTAALVHRNPHATFARIAALLHRPRHLHRESIPRRASIRRLRSIRAHRSDRLR